MAKGGSKGARVSATFGKSKTHGTKGGAREHIPHSGKKLHGKVKGGRGTRHGHGGGKYSNMPGHGRGKK